MVKLVLDKKGFDYSFLFVIVVIVVLASLFLAIYTISDRHDFKLGEVQSSLLNSFYSSESMLLFVDQAAKYSAYKSLSELRAVDFSCGKYNNVVFFNKRDDARQRCYFDAGESFKTLLNKNLNDYFSKYSKHKIPQDNYEFLLLNDSIKAVALEPVHVRIMMPKRKIGNYFIKPSFSLNIKHNIFFYDVLQQELNKTISDCAFKFSKNQTTEKISCINNLNIIDVRTQTTDNETFVFEFPQDIKNPFDKKDLNIKLAVFIPDM